MKLCDFENIINDYVKASPSSSPHVAQSALRHLESEWKPVDEIP